MSYTTRLPSPEFAGRGGGPSCCFPPVPDVPDCVPVVDAAPPDDVVDRAPVEAEGGCVEVVGGGVVAVEDDVAVCTEAEDGC
jgi:hypothetical protein